MFNLFESPDTRFNDICEGFGYHDDIDQLKYLNDLAGIGADLYQTIMFKPLCGLFNQAKYLPLRYMPIELELELADWDAPIITDLSPVVALIEREEEKIHLIIQVCRGEFKIVKSSMIFSHLTIH